ncbi:hypothetical protein CONCODRAFT_9799 [Conidiobolus coronatus NRRL 28638]|uniref:Uncharacterized protein n=1 Tax=Conidiobolus coronatus (strain ATCC 28846 / CBS 209.66 / NRRL 28638) TaxID=796925 RepID=A0A137NZE3_CONC2|nr:hypothetical protein CONCODRAFT_9799 [Conidiobolus coronatus NRRL 28638]|eukprot:KXN68068.1 hypothetical protein CONCODRAFT_9799 [Conidiobolus coronatus NRRL 28638]
MLSIKDVGRLEKLFGINVHIVADLVVNSETGKVKGQFETAIRKDLDSSEDLLSQKGLFPRRRQNYKLHKVYRPVSLKKSVIKRRKRLLVGNKRINTFPSSENTSTSTNANTQPPQAPVTVNKPGVEQPIFKVKRNPNPVVLSKPLSGEVPAIEDYLGPQKKTAENSAGVDNHYTPIKAAPSRAPAPVSYSPIF